MLKVVIKDLVKHPSCIRFISTKLCNHFIVQNPTLDIVQPVMDAWKKSNGDLKTIHSEVLRQAFKYKNLRKFQQPETWLIQLIKMSNLNYFPNDLSYDFKSKVPKNIRRPRRVCANLGQIPFRPLQPNGWSDFEEDWLSPELLFRRIGILDRLKNKNFFKHLDSSNINQIISKNFDNEKELFKLLNNVNVNEKPIALFSSKWMLKT